MFSLIWLMHGSLCHAAIIQDALIESISTRSALTGDLVVDYENGYSFGSVNQWLQCSAWTADSQYIITSATTPYNTDGFALGVFSASLCDLIDSVYIPSTTSFATIPGLSVSYTGTTGITYIAIPTRTDDHDNKVSLYKFNGIALQHLPLATIAQSFPLFQSYVSWSPNGQYLAVVTDSALQIYSFDGSRTYLVDELTVTTLPPYVSVPGSGEKNIHDISWSYDGKLLGVLDRTGGPLLFSFNGSTITQITTESLDLGGSYNSRLSFHPTKKVLAVSNNLPEDYYQTILLYQYNDSGTLSLLQSISTNQGNNGTLQAVGFAWSPDGSYFVAGDYTFLFYSFDGQVATNISSATTEEIFEISAQNPGTVSWSPDGQYVVFTRQHALAFDENHGLTHSHIAVYSTDLLQLPSLAEARAKAPTGLTNIVTSTADQFWGISGGDLMFSSTEASFISMRGAWIPAQSGGMLTNGAVADFMKSSQGDFYALDLFGKAYISTSVIVGPQVRINWNGLPSLQGADPFLTRLYQGPYGLMGSDRDNIFYRYRPLRGWLRV